MGVQEYKKGASEDVGVLYVTPDRQQHSSILRPKYTKGIAKYIYIGTIPT